MTQDEVEAVCRSLKKAVIERAMNAELSDHLGYEPGEAKPEEQSNHRNGVSGKTVITDEGPIRIEVPRIGKAASSRSSSASTSAASRVRPEDRSDVRPRHDGAGDPGLPARDVRHGGLAGVHQQGHRRGPWPRSSPGRTGRLSRVSGGVLRRAASEDPRRRGGA